MNIYFLIVAITLITISIAFLIETDEQIIESNSWHAFTKKIGETK